MVNEKNVAHSTSIIVTPLTRRLVNLWYLDNKNVFDKIVDFPESAEKARIMEIYSNRRLELENINKGLIPLPKPVKYDYIEIEASPNEPVATGYVYGYLYHMREIKDCLELALGLGAKPHAQETEEIGIAQFRVQSCTRRELQEVKRRYPHLILDVWFPELEAVKPRAEKGLGKSRVTPVAKVRVSLKPAIQENEPTRKATNEEMQLLEQSKKKHADDGLAQLEQI